jgi:ribosomal protein S18 acetylase RimI-like enzyme
MIVTSRITIEEDLERLVEEINSASWDAANEISGYDPEDLAAYLTHPDTVFIACHEVADEARVLLGIASARLEMKPYDRARWLYVDEVDVCANQRRRGAGSALMQALIRIADEADCEEVWLGAEADNEAANALYQSLNPDDVAKVMGYTWDIPD